MKCPMNQIVIVSVLQVVSVIEIKIEKVEKGWTRESC